MRAPSFRRRQKLEVEEGESGERCNYILIIAPQGPHPVPGEKSRVGVGRCLSHLCFSQAVQYWTRYLTLLSLCFLSYKIK